jgi:pimeloyl-ACP methyl ester carboxylesterase
MERCRRVSEQRTRHKSDRKPYPILYREEARFKDTYGGVEGIVFLEAHHIVPRDVESDTVLVFMHPIGGGAYLPMVSELARQGHHVIYCNSRYRGVDSALIMEKVLLDLAAAVRDAKERMGYERVVLAGWSGGGALSLLYQSQAESPTITHTPAGDPIDIAGAGLEPADAILLLAAHPSRHRVLVDSLDASITDESRPDDRETELDLYDPQNPNQPPYDGAFLERYAAAQLERNRRITRWVEQTLAKLREAGRENDERGFVVHGTMADPRWLDPAVDPNGRKPGTCFLGDPQVVNMSPVGLARFSSLRSWLSQWSADATQADGLAAARRISIPALVIENEADDVCTPRYSRGMFAARASADKSIHRVDGANHYYIGEDQIEKVQEAAEVCGEWLRERGLAGRS